MRYREGILTKPEGLETWLLAPRDEARRLLRPAPNRCCGSSRRLRQRLRYCSFEPGGCENLTPFQLEIYYGTRS